MIKNAIIFGLISYIFYDRYIKEDKLDLLRKDIETIKQKANKLYEEQVGG